MCDLQDTVKSIYTYTGLQKIVVSLQNSTFQQFYCNLTTRFVCLNQADNANNRGKWRKILIFAEFQWWKWNGREGWACKRVGFHEWTDVIEWFVNVSTYAQDGNVRRQWIFVWLLLFQQQQINSWMTNVVRDRFLVLSVYVVLLRNRPNSVSIKMSMHTPKSIETESQTHTYTCRQLKW